VLLEVRAASTNTDFSVLAARGEQGDAVSRTWRQRCSQDQILGQSAWVLLRAECRRALNPCGTLHMACLAVVSGKTIYSRGGNQTRGADAKQFVSFFLSRSHIGRYGNSFRRCFTSPAHFMGMLNAAPLVLVARSADDGLLSCKRWATAARRSVYHLSVTPEKRGRRSSLSSSQGHVG